MTATQAEPTTPRGPFGVPLAHEPETGYITRGLTTYTVDHIHVPLAEAFRRGINFLDPGYKVDEKLSAWVWTARIDDGPIAYAPDREAAIAAAKPPPRKKPYVVVEAVPSDHHHAIGHVRRDVERDGSVSVSFAGKAILRGEPVAFATGGRDNLTPEERRNIIVGTPGPDGSPRPPNTGQAPWDAPIKVDTSSGWPRGFVVDPRAFGSAQANLVPPDSGLAPILSSARLSSIKTALAKSRKVTASQGDEGLYAALTAAWAEMHPRGRIIITGKRKMLEALFCGETMAGEAALHTVGCDTRITDEARVRDATLYEATVRPHGTPVRGLRIRRSTPAEHLAGFDEEHDLWIITRPVTREQLATIEAYAALGTYIVHFGAPTLGRHGMPMRPTWLPAY